LAVDITPELTGSTYIRSTLNGSNQITFAPEPVVDSFPGDSTYWQVTGDPWVASGDSATVNNTSSNNDFLSLTTDIDQSGPAPVTFRVVMAGENVDNSGGGFGINLIATDSGGLGGGNILADVSLPFSGGTSPATQYSVTANPVALTDPSSALAPSLVAEASSLAATTYYLNVAEVNNQGTTTPGTSEASITVTSAGAQAVQFTYDLPYAVGCTGILVGMGTASGGEAQYAKVSLNGTVTYVGANSAGVTATVSGQTLTVTITSLPTDTSTAMPTSNTAAAGPITWIYAYIFARYGVGQVTVSDAEVFSTTASGASTAEYAEWIGAPFDVFAEADTAITSGSIGMERIAFFYGTPEDVDQMDSVEHAIAVLSQYDMVVMDPAGNLSARGQQLLQGLIAAGVRVYGYNNVGVSPQPTIAEINAITLACAQAGYAGCMFDGFGYDYAVTRATQNTVVAYAHSLGLSAMMNGWNPPDTLGSTVDATYNPTGTRPVAGPSDYYLFESFYTTDADQYEAAVVGWENLVAKYVGGVALAQAIGVKTVALCYAFSTTPLSETTDQVNGYILAMCCGITAWVYQSPTTTNMLAWPRDPPEQPIIGSTLVQPLEQVGTAEYQATTDQGVVSLTVDNSSGAITNVSTFSTIPPIPEVTYAAVPTVDPTIQQATTVWESSPSLLSPGWQQITGWSSTSTPPNRYVRPHVYLRNAPS